MGYYYQLKTKVLKIKKDAPPEVLNLLDEMINSCKTSEPLDHDFFKTARWTVVFANSAFHDDEPFFIKTNFGYELYLHSEINYGYEECEEFASWIAPYVRGHKPKEYIGWYKGEGDQERINLYIHR